jgi:hypothetical protein
VQVFAIAACRKIVIGIHVRNDRNDKRAYQDIQQPFPPGIPGHAIKKPVIIIDHHQRIDGKKIDEDHVVNGLTRIITAIVRVQPPKMFSQPILTGIEPKGFEQGYQKV